MSDTLEPGQDLTIDQSLLSIPPRTTLVMQGDGNLVIYRNDNGRALWDSNTVGRPAVRVSMQTDGNLVMYGAGGEVFFNTRTNGHPGCRAVLQAEGNLVLYEPSGLVAWPSSNGFDTSPLSDATDDESVGAGEHMQSRASTSAGGLISGSTHIWCNKDFAGFHGSVVVFVLDDQKKIIWPSDPSVTKHQYGVDGKNVPGLTSDRTIPWTFALDATTLANAKAVRLLQFRDPNNVLLTDVAIVGKLVEEVAPAIKAIASL